MGGDVTICVLLAVAFFIYFSLWGFYLLFDLVFVLLISTRGPGRMGSILNKENKTTRNRTLFSWA